MDLFVILEKAKPYTRTRRGKMERVKGYQPSKVYGEQNIQEWMDWYERHKGELWGTRKKRRGLLPMKETKKYKEFFGKGVPGSEMAGFSGASFASSGGTVGRENFPPQPMLNYDPKKKRKKKVKEPDFLKERKGIKNREGTPLQGGGAGWVMA